MFLSVSSFQVLLGCQPSGMCSSTLWVASRQECVPSIPLPWLGFQPAGTCSSSLLTPVFPQVGFKSGSNVRLRILSVSSSKSSFSTSLSVSFSFQVLLGFQPAGMCITTPLLWVSSRQECVHLF